MSCSDQKKNTVKDALTSKTEKPTNAKETEVWEPIPSTVNTTGQNSIPSDAII